MTIDRELDDALAELRLTTDQGARLAAEVLRHHGMAMSHDELKAALGVLIDDHERMLLSQAIWAAWHHGLLSLGVVDGEMVMYSDGRVA